MKCRELIERLEELAPPECACDWDNPGLIAGSWDQEIRTVLVALDATDQVIDQAEEMGADMILTHHPLIFKAVKQINDGDFIGRRLVRMIQNRICCYAMHTNFDIAPGCMADLAAQRLGLLETEPLEPTGERNGQPIGIGKAGRLPEPVAAETLIATIKERFELPFVTVYGADLLKEPVSRLAVSPGAGGSMISWGLKAKAQVLLTGDIGHHDGIDAAANGMAVIDAGHYGLEHIFIPYMKAWLEGTFGDQLRAETALPAFPARVW